MFILHAGHKPPRPSLMIIEDALIGVRATESSSAAPICAPAAWCRCYAVWAHPGSGQGGTSNEPFLGVFQNGRGHMVSARDHGGGRAPSLGDAESRSALSWMPDA